MVRMRGIVLLLAWVLGACATTPERVDSPRFTILQVNDVYRIEGIVGGRIGGLARLRALRRQLEGTGPVLLLHAGDVLYPSVMSKEFEARPMIEAMNLLDGAPRRFDDRLVVTFGNHDFDLPDARVLLERIEESEFTWLSSNVHLKECPRCAPQPFHRYAPNVRTTIVTEIGGLRVGVFSLTVDESPRPYVHYDYVSHADETRNVRNAVVRTVLATLKERDVDVLVALTHQGMSEDVRLAQDFPEIDVIVGGHDHTRQVRRVGRTLITKADSDVRTAQVITVEQSGGAIRTSAQPVTLDDSFPKDPEMDALVQRWLGALARKVEDYGKTFGTTVHELEGEDAAIRARETALGNWLADVARERFGAEIAFVQSGSIRLNDNIPAGGSILGEHLAGIFYFPNGLVSFRLTGEQLLAVLENAVSRTETAAGRFLQVSGVKFVYRPARQPTPERPYEVDAARTYVKDAAGEYRPVDRARSYVVATLRHTYERGHQEGFGVFAPGNPSRPPLVQGDDGAIDFRRACEEWLAAAPGNQVRVGVEGRIVRAN